MAYLPENHYCCVCGVYLGMDDGDAICVYCDELPLPELTDEERAAVDALPPDFIERILRGERPLG